MARDNDDDETTGGVASSPIWWGAGGVIVLVIIGLLWILLSKGGSGTTATPTRTVTATAGNASEQGSPAPDPSASSSTSSAVGGCAVPGGNTLVPTSAIPATWQAVGGIAVPVSPTAGPRKINGPQGALRSCYQDSPTGAVIAAMNIAGAGTTSAEQQVIEQGYTPGAGRQEAMAQPADSGGGSIGGFTTEACTQAACLVKLGFTVQGLYVEQSMPMVWSGGDWKVNGQVTGVAQAVQVTGLGGYIPMSASGAGS